MAYEVLQQDSEAGEALLFTSLPLDAELEQHADTARSEPRHHVSATISRRLYISHFLSTWNSRIFEFGAVLYLAKIFPGSLLPMSIYAFSRGLSAFLFSPAVGRYIDAGDRLKVVRLSIVLQRLVVALSCCIFWLLTMSSTVSPLVQHGLLAILSLMACVEKLCSIMNLVSVERDWVVVIAGNNDQALQTLNSQMRRIDLVCKLAGPFLISIIDGFSTSTAILVNLGMNIASVVVEYYAIVKVYEKVPSLQEPKASFQTGVSHPSGSFCLTSWQNTKDAASSTKCQVLHYLRHKALRPSLAGALLYLTVLTFGGQMVTYLLSAGYTSIHVAVARTVSVAFEISATWLAPWLMTRIGPIRSGIWFLSWQMSCLAAAVTAFMMFGNPTVAASGLVGGTILSRIGLWGFDLSSQMIVQEEVDGDQRGSFSSIEASLQSLFELSAYASTIIFSRPDQFQWPVMMSCAAVYLAGGLYASFVRSRRGHLIHFCRCIEPSQRKPSGFDTIFQRHLLSEDA